MAYRFAGECKLNLILQNQWGLFKLSAVKYVLLQTQIVGWNGSENPDDF